MENQQLIGGNKDEKATSIVAGTGAGYALAAYTYSHNNGDVGANHGSTDLWLFRIKEF